MNKIDFLKLFVKVHIYNDNAFVTTAKQILKLYIKRKYMLDN